MARLLIPFCFYADEERIAFFERIPVSKNAGHMIFYYSHVARGSRETAQGKSPDTTAAQVIYYRMQQWAIRRIACPIYGVYMRP